jgi:hypothetical protein
MRDGRGERHGLSDTPEHIAWCSMRGRCLNPNDRRYDRYGGRGITICPRWDDFSVFLADMGPKPKGRLVSIERVDNERGYSKENCIWATPMIQAANRSAFNRRLRFNGKTMILSHWARETGIDEGVIRFRLDSGWSIKDALTTKVYHGREIVFNGETLNMAEWAERTGIPYFTIRQRLDVYGWSVERALTTPNCSNKRLITFQGVTLGLNEWARKLNMPPMTLFSRISRRGWSIEKALTTPVKK